MQNRLEAVASESNAALGRVQGSFEEFKSEQRDAVASAKAEVQAEVEPRLAEVEVSLRLCATRWLGGRHAATHAGSRSVCRVCRSADVDDGACGTAEAAARNDRGGAEGPG